MENKKSCIALGFFDGVHIAHQKIIGAAVEKAKKYSLSPIVLTFDRSPSEILTDKPALYITDNFQKRQLIEKMGAKMEELKLSKALLNMEPEVFVRDILVGKYFAGYVFCGYNYSFGKLGKGNTSLLQELGDKYGFEVFILPQMTLNSIPVSSSIIRTLLGKGDIEKVTILLGRPFSVSGTVKYGKQLGRSIGFPTANVYPSYGMALPKNGVYETRITFENKTYKAVTNTGTNPTVGSEPLRTESYIPGINENLYGKNIKIEFIRFIRHEMKFLSLDELTAQIAKDVKSVFD